MARHTYVAGHFLYKRNLFQKAIHQMARRKMKGNPTEIKPKLFQNPILYFLAEPCTLNHSTRFFQNPI